MNEKILALRPNRSIIKLANGQIAKFIKLTKQPVSNEDRMEIQVLGSRIYSQVSLSFFSGEIKPDEPVQLFDIINNRAIISLNRIRSGCDDF